MNPNTLLSNLYRTEFRKIVAVLTKHYGLRHVETAEDIASETFVIATETWGKKGLPPNPTAWLYAVAKNKAKDLIKRDLIWNEKITADLNEPIANEEVEIDLSPQHIKDSELQMLFALCHPSLTTEMQVGLALRLLFGLSIEEIADAFLTNKETINKRLFRAKEKLREENILLDLPADSEMEVRVDAVVLTIYLLFNEGYHSSSHNAGLRKEICLQALQLAYLLSENKSTDLPTVNALIALMCFHASRFEARSIEVEPLLLNNQDVTLWDQQLIRTGEMYLNKAAIGIKLTKYHLEAAIAYWHTQPTDSREKWRQILNYYNMLLQIEYTPVAALNRTYALAKAESTEAAIQEAFKLKLENNHWYFALLGHLHIESDVLLARNFFEKSLVLARSESDKQVIRMKISTIN
jgi:RNA polymerase sigma-70 factor (ECF subfamily)